MQETPNPQYNYDSYISELKGRLHTAHELARKKLLINKQKSKEYYDNKSEEFKLSIRDKVLLYDETMHRGRSKKLRSQWIRPYEVLGTDKVNETIKRGQRVQKVHVNRLKPFYC
jgi:hypothetical protein